MLLGTMKAYLSMRKIILVLALPSILIFVFIKPPQMSEFTMHSVMVICSNHWSWAIQGLDPNLFNTSMTGLVEAPCMRRHWYASHVRFQPNFNITSTLVLSRNQMAPTDSKLITNYINCYCTDACLRTHLCRSHYPTIPSASLKAYPPEVLFKSCEHFFNLTSVFHFWFLYRTSNQDCFCCQKGRFEGYCKKAN